MVSYLYCCGLKELGQSVSFKKKAASRYIVDIGNDLFRAKDIMVAVLPSGIDIVWPSASEL